MFRRSISTVKLLRGRITEAGSASSLGLECTTSKTHNLSQALSGLSHRGPKFTTCSNLNITPITRLNGGVNALWSQGIAQSSALKLQAEWASQNQITRSMVVKSKLKPKFQGGKIKLRTAYKDRFRALSDGTVKVFPSGFRHRRFRKGRTQKRRLKLPHAMHHTYANTLKRMGFK